jgi:Trk-type K+ transport system membrane component
MNKKVKKSILWTVVLLIWIGLMKLAQYQVDMLYSTKVAVSQFENDAAYDALQLQSALNLIVWVIGIVGIAYCGYRIIKALAVKPAK